MKKPPLFSIVFALGAGLAVLVTLFLLPLRHQASVANEPDRAAIRSAAIRAGAPVEPSSASSRAAARQRRRLEKGTPAAVKAAPAEEAALAQEAVDLTEDQGPETEKTVREQAVTAWEAKIDQLSADETGNLSIPDYKAVKSVRDAFYKMEPKDRMDNIQYALNLLPDEQFPVLFGILFDKAVDPDILDEIFNDALNRPEELKVPLMKALMQDKEHPCYFESVRILDATGELDEEADDSVDTDL